MKLSNLIQKFAEYYVDSHEEEICDAIFEALGVAVDIEEIASNVIQMMGDATEQITEEVLNRL